MTSNFITFDSNVFAFGESTSSHPIGFQYDTASNRIFAGALSSGAMSTTVFTFGDKFYIGSNTYSLPLVDGSATNVLATDGSGTVSWVEATSGPTGATGATGATGNTGPTGGYPTLKYAQTLASKQTGVNTNGATIVSQSFTATGKPIFISVTGDFENGSNTAWAQLQLYRSTTAIGNRVHVEASAGSENAPYCLQYIDTPSAGSYTYSLKANTIAGGPVNFGETDGPTLIVMELANTL